MSYGQDKKTKSIVTIKPELIFYIRAPNNLGDNYLAKANDSKIGIGTNLNLIEVQHFKLGMGHDYISYSVTDVSKAGNYKSSRYNAFYGTLGYEIKLSNDFKVLRAAMTDCTQQARPPPSACPATAGCLSRRHPDADRTAPHASRTDPCHRHHTAGQQRIRAAGHVHHQTGPRPHERGAGSTGWLPHGPRRRARLSRS